MTSNVQIQFDPRNRSIGRSLGIRSFQRLAIASLLVSTVTIAGCQQLGLRTRDDDLSRMMGEQDDWAIPQSSPSKVPRPSANDLKSTGRREKSNSSSNDLNGVLNARHADRKQNSVVGYGPAIDTPDPDERTPAPILGSPNQEIDIDGALASLPPAYRDILKKQLDAVQRQGGGLAAPVQPKSTPPANETRVLLDDINKSGSNAQPLADPTKNIAMIAELSQVAAGELGTKKVSIRMSDFNDLNRDGVTAANSNQPANNGSVINADANVPQASDRTDASTSKLTQASAAIPIASGTPVASSTASAPVDGQLSSKLPLPAANAVQPSSPTNWRQLLAQAIEQLEKQVKEVSASDENLRISQEVTLRMLYVSQRRLEDAVRPIDKLSDSEQEYFRHQMHALYEASNPDAMPVRSRHWSLVMNSQREATNHLSAASNLEVKSVAFCTEVERYGVVTKFPKYQFQPDQELLLYCEIENVAAKKVKEGFESQLQGSYEIIDSQGRKVADQLLPMEPEVCQNHRRDYFIVYKIYMPQQISVGSYQLRLTVEDMKARKFGQSQIDFIVKK